MIENRSFSVSMCVYEKDNPDCFKIAIESILNQTVIPDEVVLVVDGPVPEQLKRIICLYEQMSIFNIIWLEENHGHGNARRVGLAACKNELVAIMDADDISESYRFEKQIFAFNNNPNADVVGGQIIEFVGTPDNVIGKRIVPLDDSSIKEYMKKRCPMNLVTVMFKKSSVENAGGFIDWYCEEDYYLWVRMLLNNMVFANVEDVLVKVRVGKDMYKRRAGLKYFKSEVKLQKYMLDNHVTKIKDYLYNIVIRMVLQLFVPNSLRAWLFKNFAREHI